MCLPLRRRTPAILPRPRVQRVREYKAGVRGVKGPCSGLRTQRGETVTVRPHGYPMTGKINDGDLASLGSRGRQTTCCAAQLRSKCAAVHEPQQALSPGGTCTPARQGVSFRSNATFCTNRTYASNCEESLPWALGPL